MKQTNKRRKRTRAEARERHIKCKLANFTPMTDDPRWVALLEEIHAENEKADIEGQHDDKLADGSDDILPDDLFYPKRQLG